MPSDTGAIAGAHLAGFGEALASGDSFWIQFTDTARVNDPMQMALHDRYHDHAVYAHPTLSEAVKEVAVTVSGTAITSRREFKTEGARRDGVPFGFI